MVSRIRLAWWREALERLDRAPPPAEPLLQAVHADLLQRGIAGADLAVLTEGWEQLLAESLGEAELALYASARGGTLFRLAARLLGDTAPAGDAGEAWALVDLVRHTKRPEEARRALDAAKTRIRPAKWSKPLRSLGMLALLAARDVDRGMSKLERPGSPARMLLMLRHRLTGT